MKQANSCRMHSIIYIRYSNESLSYIHGKQIYYDSLTRSIPEGSHRWGSVQTCAPAVSCHGFPPLLGSELGNTSVWKEKRVSSSWYNSSLIVRIFNQLLFYLRLSSFTLKIFAPNHWTTLAFFYSRSIKTHTYLININILLLTIKLRFPCSSVILRTVK